MAEYQAFGLESEYFLILESEKEKFDILDTMVGESLLELEDSFEVV